MNLLQPVQASDASSQLQGLGISGQRPEEPDLAIIDRRRATYLTYPHSSVSLDIEILCLAGYYYAGKFQGSNLLKIKLKIQKRAVCYQARFNHIEVVRC